MKTLKIIFRCIAFILFTSLILVSCEPEDTPPELTYLKPYDGENNVSVHTEIIVRYNEPVVVNDLSFSLKEAWSSITIEAEISTEGHKVILTPIDSLRYDTEYSVHFAGEISDLAGNVIRENRSWNFATISDLTHPYFVSISPRDGADSVSVDTKVIVEFSEPVIVNASDLYLIRPFMGGSEKVATEISTEGNKCILTPVEPLWYNTEYWVSIGDEITDLAGNLIRPVDEYCIFTTKVSPWGLPRKYFVWSIGANENDEMFIGGWFKETKFIYYCFFARFDNQGKLIWLKKYSTPVSPVYDVLQGPTITVTDDFIYLGARVDSEWRIDKYTMNGEKVWSSQPEWDPNPVVSKDSHFRIIPAGDGNLYILRDFYNRGQIVYKLSSEGQLISQVDCQRFRVSTMESTPYDYLLLFGQYGGTKTLAQLTYSDLSWRGTASFPSGTHMRLDGNNLFLVGGREVSKYELIEDGVNDEWSIEYNTDTRCKVKHTAVDQDGNFYVLVEDRGDELGLSWKWIKISPIGEVKATGIVRIDLSQGLIMFTVPRIAVIRNKVFVLVYDGSEWVFDLETGAKERIRGAIEMG